MREKKASNNFLNRQQCAALRISCICYGLLRALSGSLSGTFPFSLPTYVNFLNLQHPPFCKVFSRYCSAIRKNTSHLLAVWYPPALCDSFCSSIGRESEQSLLALNLPLRCCRPYLFQPTVQVFSPLKSHSLLRWSFLEAIQLLSFLAGLL